jgi:hypothetical protein
MAAIMSDSYEINPMATGSRPLVLWLAAVIMVLTFLGVADMIRPMWRGGGLDLRGVRSRLVWEEGRKVLLIEGEIANPRRVGVSVAPIRLAVRNRQGLDLHTWTITAPKAYLGAGDHTLFVARLPAPPEEGVETAVGLEPPVEAAASGQRQTTAAPRAQRLASAVSLRRALTDDIPNLRKMP